MRSDINIEEQIRDLDRTNWPALTRLDTLTTPSGVMSRQELLSSVVTYQSSLFDRWPYDLAPVTLMINGKRPAVHYLGAVSSPYLDGCVYNIDWSRYKVDDSR